MQLMIVQKGRERTCPNHKSHETFKNKYLYLLNRDRQTNEQNKLYTGTENFNKGLNFIYNTK